MGSGKLLGAGAFHGMYLSLFLNSFHKLMNFVTVLIKHVIKLRATKA